MILKLFILKIVYVFVFLLFAEKDTCKNGCDPADVTFQGLYHCFNNGSIHHKNPAKVLQILMTPQNRSSVRLSYNTYVSCTMFNAIVTTWPHRKTFFF